MPAWPGRGCPARMIDMNSRLTAFVDAVDRALGAGQAEAGVLAAVGSAMQRLVGEDGWLDPSCAVPHPQHYQQYLLHLAPGVRFSVLSFVWGPGQRTPIHDHTFWAVIGMLRGAEIGTRYRLQDGYRAFAAGQANELPTDRADTVLSPNGYVHRPLN